MLSEPGELPDADLERVVEERFNDGPWKDRDDRVELLEMLTETPGPLMVSLAASRMQRDNEEWIVERALDVVRVPEHHPAPRVAAELVLLRLVAAESTVVKLSGDRRIELHSELPTLLVGVLEEAIRSGSSKTDFENEKSTEDPVQHAPEEDAVTPRMEKHADRTSSFSSQRNGDSRAFSTFEPALLRQCVVSVQNLALQDRMSLSPRDVLWLSYRLFHWVVLQLRIMPPGLRQEALESLAQQAPAPVRRPVLDVLNPFLFEPGRVDYRLNMALFAASQMDSFAFSLAVQKESAEQEGDQKLQSIAGPSSSELEKLLARLAERELTREEKLLRHRGGQASLLGWSGPSNVPEMALSALLCRNPEALLLVHPQRRLVWFLALPTRKNAGPETAHPQVVHYLWLAVSVCALRLQLTERQLLADRVMASRDSGAAPDTIPPALMARVALLHAGDLGMVEGLRDSVLTHLGTADFPTLAGSYFLSIAVQKPDYLSDEVFACLGAAVNRDADPVPVALALGRLLFDKNAGIQKAGKRILQDLDKREPYGHDDRMRHLFSLVADWTKEE